MRFPENAALRSAESRGQGSLGPAPAGHIALLEEEPPPLPARVPAPQNSEVDPRRQLGSTPLQARGVAGELRGAHQRPARSGHPAPWAPVAAASCPSGRPPSLAAGVQRGGRREREVSVAAATRAAPFCAGKRPRRSRSQRPSPCPRSQREEGAAKEAGTERARGADQTFCVEASGLCRQPPFAGRRNNARLKRRRAAQARPRRPRGRPPALAAVSLREDKEGVSPRFLLLLHLS